VSIWRHVKINGPDTLSLTPGTQKRVDVVIDNQSNGWLSQSTEHKLFLSYRIRDSAGEMIPYEGLRTRLTDDLPPGTAHRQKIKLMIPQELYERTHSISVCILHAGLHWIDSFSREHTHCIEITKPEVDAQNSC